MKRLIAAAAALFGIAWLRRKATPQQPDPADELRAKLAQAKEADDRDEFEAGETPIDEVPDPDERRREVHERARQQIDEIG